MVKCLVLHIRGDFLFLFCRYNRYTAHPPENLGTHTRVVLSNEVARRRLALFAGFALRVLFHCGVLDDNFHKKNLSQ